MTPAAGGRLWWSTFCGTLLIYAATAHWWGVSSVDTAAASWGGWALAHGSGHDLSHVLHLPSNPFFIHIGDRVVAGRSAGVVLASVPMQLLLTPLHPRPTTAGVLTACLMTSAALGNLALLVRRLTPSAAQALAWVAVIAFGTPLWSVSSAELWTHGPAALALSCFLLAVVNDRWVLAAVAGASSLWIRPHLALVIVVVTAWHAARERRWRPVAIVGVVGALGVAALVVWNGWMFGHASIAGNYGAEWGTLQGSAHRLADPAAEAHYANGFLATFMSPSRGLFFFTPVAALGVFCAARRWSHVPDWARAALVGGLVYQAVQVWINRYSGGAAFFGNRLVVELVLLAAPACFAGYAAHARTSQRVVIWARLLTAASLATFGTGVLLAPAAVLLPVPVDGWRDVELFDVVRNTSSPAGAVVLTSMSVLALVATLLPPWLRRQAATTRLRLLVPAAARRTGL